MHRRTRCAGTQVSAPVVWLPGWSTGDEVFGALRAVLPGSRHHGCDFGGCVEASEFALAARAAVLALSTPVDLVGWSMGAMVGLELARDLPGRIRRLVLISGCRRFLAARPEAEGVSPQALERMSAALERNAAVVVQRFRERMFSAPERAAGYAGAFAAEHGVNVQPAPSLAAGLSYLGGFAVEPAALRCETFLLHGAADDLCPLSSARELADGIEGAQLTVWPDVGHAPFYTRVEATQSWLAGVLAQ